MTSIQLSLICNCFYFCLCRKKMPTICVVACCSNEADEAKGISLHVIPFFGDEEAKEKMG